MASEQIGYRRLYDAVGCSLQSQEELDVKCTMGEFEVRVYIGPQPKLGIAYSTNIGKYIIPNEQSPVFTVDYKKDARESSYTRNFFTEIICIKKIQVSNELSKLFHNKDLITQDELIDMAKENEICFKNASNLVAGVIGLRFHPQFVLEEINQNFFVMRGENDWPITISSPSMQVLEDISLTFQGIEMLANCIQGVSQASLHAQQFGSTLLAWLLHAWPERDSVSKFLSLFTPIEMILNGYDGNIEYENEKKESIVKIEKLIRAHGTDESDQLADYFHVISSNLRPSLASRFEQMAGETKIDGWEADVIAFRRFNSMRNSLLHRGDGKIQLSTTINDENIQEETRQLEDLAERYISWALFRDEVVYQSKWRPQRKRKSSM